MSDQEDISKFPDIIPNSIKKTQIWVHENDDFQTEEDISELLARLAGVFYFLNTPCPLFP